MTRHALFLINGLGLGNSTRCDSVIQSLLAQGWTVSVATSGNGSWYFGNRDDVQSVTHLRQQEYAEKAGRLDVLGTIGSIKQFIQIMRENRQIVADLVKAERPSLIVTDSVYMFRPDKDRKIPVVALNNADIVAETFRAYEPPKSVWAQFYAVELMDYFYHRLFADAVISPSLEPHLPAPRANIHRVAPIVRHGFQAPRAEETPGRGRVVIMLSGSKFGSPVHLSRLAYDFRVDIVGRQKPDDFENNDNIWYHGKLEDTFDLLSKADLLVVNGGFSAVSEAVCLKKPVVVIPVPGHAEQWANGFTIEKLGLGLVSTEENLEAAMLSQWDRRSENLAAYDELPDATFGADHAAEICERIVQSAI